MSGGDITKRDDIIWGYTFNEVLPYVEFKAREVLFREAVLHFLGVRLPNEVHSEYCRSCKQSRGIKEGDEDVKCLSCSKEFSIEESKYARNRTPT